MFCCGGSDEGHSACALQQNPEPETESPCESKYRDSGVGVCVCVCVSVCVCWEVEPHQWIRSHRKI